MKVLKILQTREELHESSLNESVYEFGVPTVSADAVMGALDAVLGPHGYTLIARGAGTTVFHFRSKDQMDKGIVAVESAFRAQIQTDPQWQDWR